MKENYFRIADLILRIDASADLLQKELELFRTTVISTEPDIYIIVSDEPCSKEINGKKIVSIDALSIFEDEETLTVRYRDTKPVRQYVNFKDRAGSIIYIDNRTAPADTVYEREGILDNLVYSIRDAFFYHMQKKGRIAIHSASVIYRDRAWLFSACSGTGKSTHVRMWREAGFEFEDLNGDLAICYMKDGKAVAASSPWCGTSGIFCDRVIPFGGIFYLAREEKSSVKRLSELEGVMSMAARCISPNWNREMVNRNIDITQQIVKNIVFSANLYCRPDIAAAAVSKAFIDEAVNGQICS